MPCLLRRRELKHLEAIVISLLRCQSRANGAMANLPAREHQDDESNDDNAKEHPATPPIPAAGASSIAVTVTTRTAD